MLLSRRSALLGLAASWQLGHVSLALADTAGDKRFVVVILRGALDGMSAIVPYGDPALPGWRAPLIPPAVGTPGGMLDLGGFYGLHPDLAPLHDIYAAGELLPVHAIAGHYRSRSHFEAQDYMESGADQRMTSGWLNRAVENLPTRRATHATTGGALSVGLSMPLLLRGPATVESWAPQGTGRAPPELYAQIAELNRPDPLLGPALADALRARGTESSILAGAGAPPPRPNAFPNLAHACGSLLAAPDGPRIAALEIGGWDTHGAQNNRLKAPMGELSTGLAALKAGLGPAWADTAVLVMTEFGRTARINGTNGTDHGTGTIAFALGGRVDGGRVLASWPGLAQAKLLENRDLQPTADLRSLAKGLLKDHLGLQAPALARIFPGSDSARPMTGLLRTA